MGLGFGALAQAQPTNDNFASATILAAPSGSVTGSSIGAGKEPGEPDHGGNAGGHSIWYSWQASIDGPVTFDTGGSDFDTLLDIYTGSSVSNLTCVASNDDLDTNIFQSKVQFVASAGTTYRIAIDGYAGGSGSVVLTWAGWLEIRTSGPLTSITTGPDGSFQVHHASFANGQAYHPDFAPADAGFFVRQSDGIVNGLNLYNRRTAAEDTFALPFYPIAQSMSQNGLEATIVMDNRNDFTANRFQVTQVTRYRPGDEFFVVENTVLNQGTLPFTADYFAAADLYLADSDEGFAFEHSVTGAVGGTDSNRVHHILVQGKPGNPVPVLFQEGYYDEIWKTIGTPGLHFTNTINTDYTDNGAGLEWPNVTLEPGASITIAYCWAFGAPSDLAVSLAASPGSVNIGDQLIYQAMVTNIGTVTVTGAALTDALPSGVDFLSASTSRGSCVNQGGTITCSLDTLTPGESALVTILVERTTGGAITNTVAVSGNQADMNLFNNTGVAVLPGLGDRPPVLTIRAAGPDIVLRWPAICSTCVLEQVAQLKPPILWRPVGTQVVTLNGTNQVTLPRGASSRFFRLGPGQSARMLRSRGSANSRQ